MSKKRVTMWVAPEFRKAMKKKAADADKDMISFTGDMAGSIEDNIGFDQPNKPKKKKNDFSFF